MYNRLFLTESQAGERDAALCLLAEAGASTAQAVFAGSGDRIAALTARSPGGGTISLRPEVEARVRDLASNTLPEEWVIDTGGEGSVVFDVLAGQMRYSLYSRYTKVKYDEWVA